MPLKLKKRKGSPYWYLRGTVQGQPIYEPTGIPHAGRERPQPNAEAYRLKKEKELEDFAVHGRSYSATFKEAAETYLQAGGSPRFLERIVEKIGDDYLKDMNQSYIDKIAREIYPNCTPESLNRQFYTPFIAVWRNASRGQNPLCQVVLWARPKMSPTRARARKPEDYKKVVTFLNGTPLHAAKIAFFLFWTGCRPIEALTLECENVYPDKAWAVLMDTKTGIPRGIPLHKCLIPMLREEIKKGGKVFRNKFGEPYADGRKFNKAGRIITQGGGQFGTAIEMGRRKSKITTITPYTARHTVSTYLVWPGGVHTYIKDEILGHAPESEMSAHYVHLPRQPLIRAINKLPDPSKMGLRSDLILCKIRATKKEKKAV